MKTASINFHPIYFVILLTFFFHLHECLAEDASQPFVNAYNFRYEDINFLTWTTKALSYQTGSGKPFRCEFNSVNFAGSDGITGIGVFFQNVSHFGPPDTCFAYVDGSSTGIWLTAQSDMVPTDFGVTIIDSSGSFQRSYTMIDGMAGIYGRQVYSVNELGYPEIIWKVVKGEVKNGILASDKLTRSTDGSCSWIGVSGLFREWDFFVNINNTGEKHIARYYIPIEYGDEIRPFDPIVLHPEYQSPINDDLSRSIVTFLYYDFGVKSEYSQSWTNITDFSVIRFPDPQDNVDTRFGYDVNYHDGKKVLVATCGIYSASKEDTVFTDIGINSLHDSEWHIGIQAAINDKIHDLSNSLGVKNDASFGYDAQFDILEPDRPPSNYLELYFPHPEWKSPRGYKFTTDYIKNSDYRDTTIVWNCEINTDQSNQIITVRTNIEPFVPNNINILLHDTELDSLQDIKSNEYQYSSGPGGIRRFQLLLGYFAPTIFAPTISTLPDAFALLPNYPNPFNTVTIIGYRLPKTAHVRLAVYNTLGREVVALVNGVQPAGGYQVNWDASRVPNGIYLIHLEAGDFTEVRKAVLLK